MLGLIFSCVVFYLIGSIPAGYLIVKKKYNKDLTREGSKNVGTLNTLTVSKSKTSAALVLIFDFLKGAGPVYYVTYVLELDFIFVFVSSIFLVIGHNYPVWLRFKGGRGLATAAGIFSIVNILLLLSWVVFWLVYFFLIKKDVLAANLTATVLYPFFTVIFKGFYLNYVHPALASNEYYFFIIFGFIVSFLILSKHTEVFSKFKLRHNKSQISNLKS